MRDHCHLTGKYRGAAHKSCNLNYKVPKFAQVYFHNLAEYDAHLFIKSLGKTEGNISIFQQIKKIISVSVKKILVDSFTDKDGKEHKVYFEIRFIDSIKFLLYGLEKLVPNLPKESFKNLYDYFGKNYSEEKLKLLMRKGVFPYEWFDNYYRLEETALPPKVAFYSKLRLEGISDSDYEHAQKVWKEFKCETSREYRDLYLICDTLQQSLLKTKNQAG